MTHPHCRYCGEHIKLVLGGQGKIWIHESGYVVCRTPQLKIEHGRICRAEPEEESA
jgi:hypothetical protein